MSQLSEIEIINGGRNATAHFKDGTAPEAVFVRQVSVRELPRYAALVDDEPALLEFLIGRPEGFSDRLTLESFEELFAIGEELNSDPFHRWLKRKMATFEKLGGAKMLGQLSALGTLPRPSAPAADSLARS